MSNKGYLTVERPQIFLHLTIFQQESKTDISGKNEMSHCMTFIIWFYLACLLGT